MLVSVQTIVIHRRAVHQKALRFIDERLYANCDLHKYFLKWVPRNAAESLGIPYIIGVVFVAA